MDRKKKNPTEREIDLEKLGRETERQTERQRDRQRDR